jgi:DUF1680 family protein
VLQTALAVPIRLTSAHPRVDAARACVAIERGPLVYCLESDDVLPAGALEDVLVDTGAGVEVTTEAPVGLEDYVPVTVQASGRRVESSARPLYGKSAGPLPGEPVELTFVPYFARAHRASTAMRVWVPRADD